MPKKSGNTPAYRAAKRVTSFVLPQTKKAILELKKKEKKKSISSITSDILNRYFGFK